MYDQKIEETKKALRERIAQYTRDYEDSEVDLNAWAFQALRDVLDANEAEAFDWKYLAVELASYAELMEENV